MTLRTEIATVRSVAAGEGVGYGHTWHAPQAGFVATLPVGYADGVPWSGARGGCVAIAGARRPLAGRVSMDSITVWRASEQLPVGEDANALGGTGDPQLGVEQWASAAGTRPYELLVRVGTRVARRFRA
jgi:alanine racemase